MNGDVDEDDGSINSILMMTAGLGQGTIHQLYCLHSYHQDMLGCSPNVPYHSSSDVPKLLMNMASAEVVRTGNCSGNVTNNRDVDTNNARIHTGDLVGLNRNICSGNNNNGRSDSRRLVEEMFAAIEKMPEEEEVQEDLPQPPTTTTAVTETTIMDTEAAEAAAINTLQILGAIGRGAAASDTRKKRSSTATSFTSTIPTTSAIASFELSSPSHMTQQQQAQAQAMAPAPPLFFPSQTQNYLMSQRMVHENQRMMMLNASTNSLFMMQQQQQLAQQRFQQTMIQQQQQQQKTDQKESTTNATAAVVQRPLTTQSSSEVQQSDQDLQQQEQQKKKKRKKSSFKTTHTGPRLVNPPSTVYSNVREVLAASGLDPCSIKEQMSTTPKEISSEAEPQQQQQQFQDPPKLAPGVRIGLDENGNTYIPTSTDIVCGRGKGSMKHPGNQLFMNVVRKCLANYTDTKCRHDRSVVICGICSLLKESGLRFIKLDKVTRLYTELPYEDVHQKVGHAIRDILSRETKLANEGVVNDKSDNIPYIPSGYQWKGYSKKTKVDM